MTNSKIISPRQAEELFASLKSRFQKNMKRHQGIAWEDVEKKLRECLTGKPDTASKLWSLYQMEITGGEPDVVSPFTSVNKAGYKTNHDFIFIDCATESPAGRRSLCYDREALESRKENKPKDNVLGMASEMGIELLNEEEYRELHKFGEFDTKTSSWLKTPDEIRKLGGALFGDFRYGKVFVYHNGASSYYAVRAFRGFVRILKCSL